MVSPTKPEVGDTSSASPIEMSTPPASDASCIHGSDNLGGLTISSKNIPAAILRLYPVCCGSDGNAFILFGDGGNARALQIGSQQALKFLRNLAHRAGVHLKAGELRDINDALAAHAEITDDVRDVWYRVAPFRDGIELDVGDDRHTRIRVMPGRVEIVDAGSVTLFYRTPGMRPFVLPADDGDLRLLDRYLNLRPAGIVLLVAWISYTLAHPKVPTTNFPILVLQGDQGSGKTLLCRMIETLIDPRVIGVQTFPHTQKDLAIAGQHAHVLFYDNLRTIRPLMADTLSIAATGGALTTRQLYTDTEQQVHRVHVALVLNGIHSFIDQPDLAQRCLPLQLLSIEEQRRRSETDLIREFQADLPRIFRSLLDLVADVLTQLPSVQVENPERMIDFVRWLAAIEQVDGAPAGVYQAVYSAALGEAMLDSLHENPLAAAVMSFAAELPAGQWSGTPSDLLQELSYRVGRRAQYSSEWPQNAIALSKRLQSLRAALRRQGIDVELVRGSRRRITIVRTEG
jgi:hypothetical protein